MDERERECYLRGHLESFVAEWAFELGFFTTKPKGIGSAPPAPSSLVLKGAIFAPTFLHLRQLQNQ